MKTFSEYDQNLGIKTEVHDLDSGKVVIAKKYDAQPMLDACAAERAATSGQKWGEMRKVGSIPMAELSKMMRQDGSIDPQRCLAWIKANPAFATFDRFLK